MSYAHRKPLAHIVARYDRLARFYRRLEFLFLITPHARRKAVSALDLGPGNVVLEIGAGTGRNLRYLVDAVGPTGRVIAIDASPGMLGQARRLVHDCGWRNVELLQQDAAELEVEDEVDAVLFSLSYSVIPDPRPALAAAWKHLRPAGRLVVMDLGLTNTAFRGLLKPVANLLDKLAPGDAYSQPWTDLSAYGPVTTERFMLDLYYVCAIRKPAS